MRRASIPPYKDSLLSNRPGEKWDDIPGLDGYFRVSNFGRIKRMEREMVHTNGSIYLLKEKILAPRLQHSPNLTMKDQTHQLAAHLCLERRRYHFPIRRLVYTCFVAPIALDDPEINIVSRNGNGLDIHPRNLLQIQRNAMMKRVYQRGRVISSFVGKPNTPGVEASLKVTCKPVSQYDRKGKWIRTFPSMMQASRETGIRHGQISHSANGIEPTAGGFYWRHGKRRKWDLEKFLEERRLSFKEKKGMKVTQLTLSGEPIAWFLTLNDAGKALGKSYTAISAMLRGKTKTAYGFKWKKGFYGKK
ncbi:MAG: NUMOD4 domain-containing protein [Bacteroidota bacterium]|nr:NUMOD4 domain-containing protein [Bacteroidota bacterium]MDP4249652.1 NUMOD4 domain-containing protein [Bacteroidota bacterium]